VTEIVEMSLDSSAAQVHAAVAKTSLGGSANNARVWTSPFFSLAHRVHRAHPAASFFLPFLFQASRRVLHAQSIARLMQIRANSVSFNPFTFSLRLRFFAFGTNVNPMVATPPITPS